jgi:16S rRNA (guanine527-N7)-methyltransferase
LLDFLEEARRIGVLGQGLVAFHVAHAAGFADAVEHLQAAEGSPARPDSFIDLGSGAGVPGLVLAARWQNAAAVLLDASEARTEALRGIVAALGWEDRVRVVRGRAETAGRDPDLRGHFPLAVARGFGGPPVVAECASPLLRIGALLAVSEPPFEPSTGAPGDPGAGMADTATVTGLGAWDTARWPLAGAAELGLEPLGWYRHRFGYQLLRQRTLCPDRFPRRAGIPAKRPLWR